jgi:ubiquinone/menaquinone biosynthesis C-methylase UbiE
VLEHVEDDLSSLKEINRVLAPGGTFFFCFLPFWLSWSQRLAHARGDFYHSRLYKISGVKAMAHQVGFKTKHIWHGQLLPKNSLAYVRVIEKIDRFLTRFTFLKYFSTNLEGFLVKE